MSHKKGRKAILTGNNGVCRETGAIWIKNIPSKEYDLFEAKEVDWSAWKSVFVYYGSAPKAYENDVSAELKFPFPGRCAMGS